MKQQGLFLVLLLGALLTACSTYYQLNYEFNRNFETGQLVEADQVLEENKKAEKSKARLIYFMNKGVVTSLLGKYEESNTYLEKAYLLGEDYQNNYLNVAFSMVSNPTVIEYKGEDHEHLMVLYYKAINFLMMGDRESALVECRRLNNKLLQLSDRYTSGFKYKEDAFIHTLIGIIYEADKDYNNAFIAYRNAHRIYKEVYTSMFGLDTPDQLKKDLIRTAALMGFDREQEKFENEFGMKYEPKTGNQPELVMFWNNGLGPVKSEWSINFTVVKGSGGAVTFVNEEYDFSFPFFLSNDSESQGGLGDLEFFRVTFPKYVERPLMFENAVVKTPKGSYPLQKAESVNAIAFKELEQRMVKEFSKSLLRFAIKKAAEESLRKEDEGLGAALGILNAATEKADTRNWQTIPHSIYYARVPLEPGMNNLTFQTITSEGDEYGQSHPLRFDANLGNTYFHSFHSLEISPRYMSRSY